MQTILGAGGLIANELASSLRKYTNELRLVSRNPTKLEDSDELVSASLMDKSATFNAVAGSEVTYLTVGLPYETKLWVEAWPIILQNVVEACETHQSKLVFFDNVYMYSPLEMGHMTEESEVAPTSKKGKARMKAARIVEESVEKGKINAVIARAADFYGPKNDDRSVLYEMVFKNLANGKKANWLGDYKAPHSYTYTPDAGHATALLGNTDDAFDQVWHLPTYPDPWTGEEWVAKVADFMDKPAKAQVLGKGMARFLGIFMGQLRETIEMFYQFDQPYVFDSSKFSNHFGISATSYQDGLENIIKSNFS